jgi:hypothetical protein
MTDKPRQRSVESANDEVNRDPKDLERDAGLEEEVKQVDDPPLGDKAEEERILLEELAEYEPCTAYD